MYLHAPQPVVFIADPRRRRPPIAVVRSENVRVGYLPYLSLDRIEVAVSAEHEELVIGGRELGIPGIEGRLEDGDLVPAYKICRPHQDDNAVRRRVRRRPVVDQPEGVVPEADIGTHIVPTVSDDGVIR